MLDSLESSNVDTVTGLEKVAAENSFSSTDAFKLTSATTATVGFKQAVAIDSDVLALDATGLYRSEKITVSLLCGNEAVATDTVSVADIDSSVESSLLYYSNQERTTKHTLIFKLSDLTEEERSYITGLQITYNGASASSEACLDNLRVISNASSDKIDFEDLSNISNLTELDIVDDTTVIDGLRSVKYNGSATNDNWMGIHFNTPISVGGKYIKFRVSGLGEDNTLALKLLNGATTPVVVANASHTYREYTETYGSDRVVDLYLEFTDLTPDEMNSIGGILIRHYSWTTNKITIDSIEFVDALPSYSAYSSGTYSQEGFYLTAAGPYGYSSQYTGSTETALDNIKAANMNMVEFTVYDGKTQPIAYAEQIGLDAIVNTSFSGSGDSKIPFDYSSLDWDLAARLELQKYTSFNNVKGYYVYDEPSLEKFDFVSKINSYIEKYDPARLRHTCLLPSYSFYDPNTGEAKTEGWTYSDYESYVDTYISTLNPQVLSFDYYPFTLGWSDVREQDWYKDMGLYRNRAILNDIPFWYYINCVDASGNLLSANKVSVQMNVALAYGAKAISVFGTGGYLYDSATFERADDFDTKAALNKQTLNIGNLLYDKTATAIYHTGMSDSVENEYYADDLSSCDLLSFSGLNNWQLNYSNDAIISIFEGTDSKKYVMVVNKNLSSALSTTVKLSNSYSISLFDAENNTINSVSSSASSISLNVVAGGAVVYIIE